MATPESNRRPVLKSFFKNWALITACSIGLGVIVVTIFPDDHVKHMKNTATPVAVIAALQKTAAARSARISVGISASKGLDGPNDGDEVATSSDGGSWIFDLDADTRGYFRLTQPPGTQLGTVTLTRRDGRSRVSRDPAGLIGDLGPDSFTRLVQDTVVMARQASPQADDEAVQISGRLSPESSKILLDLVKARPEGRRILAGFAAPRSLPIDVFIPSRRASTVTEVFYTFESRAATDISFSVTIRPRSLNAPVKISPVGDDRGER